MRKYNGELDELINAVAALGYVGVWEQRMNGARYWMFRAKTGEILNWYETTGSLSYQGNNPIELERRLGLREFERRLGKGLF